LQDGLYAELFDPETLGEIALWRRCAGSAAARSRRQPRRYLRPIIDRIRQTLLEAVARESRRRLDGHAARAARPGASRPADALLRVAEAIALPADVAEELRQLEAFL